ncbi:hypothetical protein BC832DRAFT_541096 [Gaertneriomyces semiglobifer]|nr:hypothetical protein BC832DRAFT_541096 [Gaertneriomyces semiglobifer]
MTNFTMKQVLVALMNREGCRLGSVAGQTVDTLMCGTAKLQQQDIESLESVVVIALPNAPLTLDGTTIDEFRNNEEQQRTLSALKSFSESFNKQKVPLDHHGLSAKLADGLGIWPSSGDEINLRKAASIDHAEDIQQSLGAYVTLIEGSADALMVQLASLVRNSHEAQGVGCSIYSGPGDVNIDAAYRRR